MLPWKWPMNQTSQSCCQWKEINLHEPCLAVSSPLQHPPGYRDSNMDTWHLIHWKLHRNQTDCRITFLAMLQHSITFVTTSSTESDTERGWLTGHVTTVLMSWWFLIPSSATSLSFLPFRLNPVQSHNLHLHNTSKSLSCFTFQDKSWCFLLWKPHRYTQLSWAGSKCDKFGGKQSQKLFPTINIFEHLCGRIGRMYFLNPGRPSQCWSWIHRFLSPSSFVNRHTFLNACQEIFCFTIDLFLLIEAVRQKICRRRENLQTGKQKFISTYQSGLQNSNAKYRPS